MREPSDSADAAAELLAGTGARWALIGALAALRYRDAPRLTTDVDLLVEPVDGLAEAFERAGYTVRQVADPGEEPHMLVIRGHGDRIDVLLARIEYQRVALERAAGNVLTVEDVLVHKLIAWRPRDRDDVASILRAGNPIDEAYVERWASAWDVSDRWRQALAAR